MIKTEKPKLGQLVIYLGRVMQITGINPDGNTLSVYDFYQKKFDEWDFDSYWELTTAYDSNINPSDLPVPEPIDTTGWVLWNGKKQEIIGMLECMPPKLLLKANEGNRAPSATECQPCLPPEQQPEQWDLNIHYWDKNKKVKGSIVLDPQSNDYLFIWIHFKKDSLLGDYRACSPHVDTHEPYDNQDAKIDFGKAGRILYWENKNSNKRRIVVTTGDVYGRDFKAFILWIENTSTDTPCTIQSFNSNSDRWQDITEQFNELLKQL